MKPSVQTNLPGVRDWRERQICDHHELPALLTQAAQAAFEAIRLELWRNGYRVTFQAMPAATDSRGARAIEPLEDSNHFATKTQPLPPPPVRRLLNLLVQPSVTERRKSQMSAKIN
jgi:hypothetical protein